MALTLRSKMKAPGPSVYYTPQWHRLLETHMRWLRESIPLRPIQIQDQLAYKYEGDLFGLLQEIGIDDVYHWVVMRVNGLNSPLEYSSDRTVLLIPPSDQIDRLMAIFKTTQNKIR